MELARSVYEHRATAAAAALAGLVGVLIGIFAIRGHAGADIRYASGLLLLLAMGEIRQAATIRTVADIYRYSRPKRRFPATVVPLPRRDDATR